MMAIPLSGADEAEDPPLSPLSPLSPLAGGSGESEILPEPVQTTPTCSCNCSAVLERLARVEERLAALEGCNQQQPVVGRPQSSGTTSTPVANFYPPEMFQDEGESPLTKVLDDVEEENLPVERTMTMAACRMSNILFSPATLQRSTLQGRNDTASLDPRKLNFMLRKIKGRFGQRCTSDSHFRSLWKKCRQSLSAKCKHLRSRSMRSINFDD